MYQVGLRQSVCSYVALSGKSAHQSYALQVGCQTLTSRCCNSHTHEALGALLTAVTVTTKHCSRKVTETVQGQTLMNWTYGDTGFYIG